MNDTSKAAMDRLKEIPGEVRETIQERSSRFADKISQAFSGSEEGPRPQHVVPREEGWAVVGQGAERATRVTDTKEEAVEAGRELARKKETYLVVHRKDGTIQEVRNYRDA